MRFVIVLTMFKVMLFILNISTIVLKLVIVALSLLKSPLKILKRNDSLRNPRIARVLEDLGYVRQLNEGVSRIYESMEKSLLAKPEYREQNNNVYLTLRNRVTAHEKTVSTATMLQIEKEWTNYNDTQKAILLYLFTNGTAILSELVDYTKINQNSIRAYLNAFIQQGIIERQSVKQRDPNAKYAFRKD